MATIHWALAMHPAPREMVLVNRWDLMQTGTQAQKLHQAVRGLVCSRLFCHQLQSQNVSLV
jgi:hypothetical protein